MLRSPFVQDLAAHVDHRVRAMLRRPARLWRALIHALIACSAVCVHRSSNQPCLLRVRSIPPTHRLSSALLLQVGSLRRTRAQVVGVRRTESGPVRQGPVGRRPLGRSHSSRRSLGPPCGPRSRSRLTPRSSVATRGGHCRTSSERSPRSPIVRSGSPYVSTTNIIASSRSGARGRGA